MKNLKEMTGVEVFEALIMSGRKIMIDDMFSVFGGNDLQILSHKVRSIIMGVLSEKAFLFNPLERIHYEKEYIQTFFMFIGVDSSLPINEAEIIEKSMKIGNGETARNIFGHAIRANPLVLGDLCKEAKEEMLNHLYMEGRTTAEKEVLNEDDFRTPEYIAGLKALLDNN
jgi:hypothetical protein